MARFRNNRYYRSGCSHRFPEPFYRFRGSTAQKLPLPAVRFILPAAVRAKLLHQALRDHSGEAAAAM